MKYSLLLAALLSTSSLVANSNQVNQNIANQNKIHSLETQVSTIDTKVATVGTKVTSIEDKLNSIESELSDIKDANKEELLAQNSSMLISVTGQGVAPMNTSSPAQAYALAKRAATADAYRLIAEKVKGVRIDGQDLIKNMMVKRSTVRTSVKAMVRNANVVETTFKEGLCEVEMEIHISHAQFAR